MSDDFEPQLDLKRFWVRIPPEWVAPFLRGMAEEERTAPDYAERIIVRYLKRKELFDLQKIANESAQRSQESEIPPSFGPKPLPPDEQKRRGWQDEV